MTVLANPYSKAECLKRLAQEHFSRKTVSFYRYVRFGDPEILRDTLFKEWSTLGVLGRIYLAREGINAQMSVPEPRWDEFVATLNTRPELQNMMFKVALEEPTGSFWKLTIKIKKQIVADGLPDEAYNTANVGNHLTAEEFNRAMAAPGTLVVDMRNHYESRIGHFENAICPDVDTFKEELQIVPKLLKGHEDKKVLLYCTGGIRCEKASAYLKSVGFKDVNQLHGGIIQYAHEVKEKRLRSRFRGVNFVFDGRMAEHVTDDVLAACDQCGHACNTYSNCANVICNLLFLQCQDCRTRHDACCGDDCQRVIHLPPEEQRQLRKQQKSSTFEVYRKRIRPEIKSTVSASCEC